MTGPRTLTWSQRTRDQMAPVFSIDDLVVRDGMVACPSCKANIRVGMGGLQNFLKQHKPGISKACQLNLQKKNSTSAHQQSQPRLESFFKKGPKALIPPTIPTPLRVVAYAMEPTSSGPSLVNSALTSSGPPGIKPASTGPTRVPDPLVNNLLTKLESAIANLPNLPEASERDELAVFAQHIPTDMNQDDAWESLLDPLLNRFLGFGRSIESISEALRGGEMGLVAMARFLRTFVARYHVEGLGALLEGKLNQLMKAIEMR